MYVQRRRRHHKHYVADMLFADRWDEISSCIANSTELKMFPTFAYAYRRSYLALPIDSARDADQLGEFAFLLSLLRGISTNLATRLASC